MTALYACPAGADKISLRGDCAVADKCRVKAGVIIKPALPGGHSRRGSTAHQLLGIKNAFIQDVLMHGNVGVAFEIMKEGIFAEIKPVR